MKRKFTKLMAAFALLVFTMPSLVAWGQEVTLSFTSNTWELPQGSSNGATESADFTDSETGYTITLYATTAYYYNTSGMLMLGKKNSTLTLPAFTFDVDKIVVTGKSGASGAVGQNIYVGETAVSTATTGATGTNTYNINSNYQAAGNVYTLMVTTAHNTQITKIEIYKKVATSVATPTFTPEAGIYAETQSVTISCETQGSAIYYTTDGSTPDNTSTQYDGAITVSETTTINAIAYVGDDASSVASATYTIVQPLTTMQAIYDKATEVGSTATYTYITLGNWIVSGVSTNGKNVFVTDGTKGFVVFDNGGNMGFAAGNILSGTVSCKVQLYNGFAELTQLNSTTSGLSIATGGTVTAANIDMADLAGVNTGALVHYDNLTCSIENSKYYLSDGTTTLQVYNALYAFDALTAGKTYNITGVYQQFNSTKEILPRSAADIEEAVSTEPSITVTPATLHVEAGQHVVNDELTITFDNIDVVDYESFTIQFYNAEGEGQEMPEWLVLGVTGSNDEGYQVNGYISANESEARSSYFKVHVGETYSNLVTINQDAYVAPALDYATLPFAFDGGRADIETTNGLTQDGLDSDYGSSPKLKFNTTGDWVLLHFEGTPGTLSFDIKGNSFSGSTFTVQTSEDGVTYTDLINYTDANFDNTLHSEEFTNLGENVRYIKWIYTEKVQNGGNVALGNIILAEYVAPQPSITVESDVINVDADSHQEFLSVTFVNFQPTTGYAFTCDANGTFTDYSWLVAELDINNSRVRYTISNNEGEARTAYFMVRCGDVDSEMVTVNQAAYVAPTASKYVKVTSMDDLTDGQYLIVYEDGGLAFDGSLETLDASNNTIEVNPNDGEIAVTSETTAAEFTIDVTEGTIKSASGLYIGQTSDANGMKTSATEAYTNTITIDEDGDADVVASGGAYLRYNANSGQERFRYFKSSTYTNQKAIQLYRKEEAVESYELTIEGYADDNTKDGYYLIASPVTVDLTNHDMTTGDFDLYYYDDAQELEWINYEGEDGDFDLIPGKGYLYAKKATDENPSYSFTLTGTPYDGDGEIELATGWNLVGNPFGVEAEISMDYYALTPTAIELIPTEASTNVAPMQGVFVQYTTEDPTVIFMPSETGTNTGGGEKLVMNVNGNRGNVIDRAIVRFGEGRTLSKFQLNPNNTKIYVTEGNQDFAIVRSANEADMPVSFRASENGTYTLSIEAENVEMNYLHLIDNMTGADVDLLATPNYTFEARTNDYTSRFRLVFNANGTTDNEVETFAYFNGSNWTVNNLGEATLQVVDVTGRIVSSETINGNATISLNQTPGVYMFRLVSGNGVKVQKVVVK